MLLKFSTVQTLSRTSIIIIFHSLPLAFHFNTHHPATEAVLGADSAGIHLSLLVSPDHSSSRTLVAARCETQPPHQSSLTCSFNVLLVLGFQIHVLALIRLSISLNSRLGFCNPSGEE